MTMPHVSIVVPTLNAMGTIDELVARVRHQNTTCEIELVAIDSGSTDGTRAFLQSYFDAVIEIPASAFNHGSTRNLGMERAHGEFVVMMSQDAWPANPHWLEALIHPLTNDPKIAASVARQIARPDASEITRLQLSRSPNARHAPRVVCFDRAADFEACSPQQKLDAASVDNVCTCYRRSVWDRHHFEKTDIAEDVEWALQVLRAGHALAYVPGAGVIHSHERSTRYELKRTFLVHRKLGQLFGLRTVDSMASLGQAMVSQARVHVDACTASGEPRLQQAGLLPRAIGLAIAWPLGQYLGGLAAKYGVYDLRLRGV